MYFRIVVVVVVVVVCVCDRSTTTPSHFQCSEMIPYVRCVLLCVGCLCGLFSSHRHHGRVRLVFDYPDDDVATDKREKKSKKRAKFPNKC